MWDKIARTFDYITAGWRRLLLLAPAIYDYIRHGFSRLQSGMIWIQSVLRAFTEFATLFGKSILVCLFMFLTVKISHHILTVDSINLGLISIPEALSKRGYTQEVFTRTVAAEIDRMWHESSIQQPYYARVTTRADQFDMNSTDGGRRQIETILVRRITHNVEQLDIQIPGQAFSLVTLVRYIKQIFGHEDPRLTVSVTEERQFYAVDVQIVGGDYGRSSATLKVSTANSVDDLVRAAAKGAMRVATPLVAAAYEIRHEEAHCTGSSCKYDVALEILSRLIVKPPKADDKWALLARAHVHLRLDQPGHAIRDIQNATKLDSQLSDSYIYWGVALTALGQQKQAIEKYKKAADINPKELLSYIYWGLALAELGEENEAIEKYKKVLELDPKYAGAYNNWGLALVKLGRRGEAIEKYKKATEIDPDYPFVYFNWGLVLAQVGQHKEAIEKYQIAVKFDPKNPGIYYSWGEALRNLGRDREAIEKYRQATEVEPNYVRAYVHWGNALKALGQVKEAIEKYKTASEINPNDPVAYNNWGLSLAALGRFKEAIEKYNNATAIRPDYVDPYLHRAFAFVKLGRHKEAIEQYKKVTAIKPTYRDAYIDWGNTLGELGQHKEAVEMYKKALQIDPKSAIAYHNLGSELMRLGRRKEALEMQTKGAELDPKYPVDLR